MKIPAVIYAIAAVAGLHLLVIFALMKTDVNDFMPKSKSVMPQIFQLRTIHYVDVEKGTRTTERRYTVSTRLATEHRRPKVEPDPEESPPRVPKWER